MKRGFPIPKGMVLVVVVGCLFFVTLIFAALVNRVRHESSLTSRASINERLYQLASAIGRVAVKKLERDIKDRDQDFGKKIIDAVFNNTTGVITEKNYTSTIVNLDVVKAIIDSFQKKWGDLKVEVEYTVSLDPPNFPPFMPNLEASPFERSGRFEFVVTCTFKKGYSYAKKCKIVKEFFIPRLLAPPFHKFTLFALKGAKLNPSTVNRIANIDEDGKVSDSNPPLILFNKRIKDDRPGQTGLDFTLTRPGNIVRDASSYLQNGWIYLGEEGNSAGRNKTGKYLILNVCAGAKGANPGGGSKEYGEFFHFYFDSNSQGWQNPIEWNQWLDNKLGAANGQKVLFVFVDYGHYTGLKNLKFPPGTGLPLFQGAVDSYEGSFSGESVSMGSALHLFGTPTLCTPTLVFGAVKRRYVRTFAIYLGLPQKLYPLREMYDQKALNDFWTDEFQIWAANKIQGKYDTEYGPLFNKLYDLFDDQNTQGLTHNLFSKGDPNHSPPLCQLSPEFRDYEPYMIGLKNISQPTDPSVPWSAAVFQNNYIGDKPDNVCVPDYQFNDDPELHYTGQISALYPRSDYLKKRVSYRIPKEEANGGVMKLSQCQFFIDEFVKGKRKGNNLVELDQVISFESDLEIDMPLEIVKGGIILCDGRITISAPVYNSYVLNKTSPLTNPDCFGYLTLVSNKKIEIKLSTAPSGSAYPQFHGFLVCFASTKDGEVIVDRPTHIIGGVAADKIDTLVEKGGIIEWGFESGDQPGQGEVTGSRDFTNRDFYGIAMGPRDTEIVIEE